MIEEENLCERTVQLGKRLKQRLEGLRDDVPEIADIRGPGFMNAIEFNSAVNGSPAPDFASRVRSEALDRGLILLTCGVRGNVIRFLALITIHDAVFSEAPDVLETSIRAAQEG